MAYQSVWWHSPYEYGQGVAGHITWPTVTSQYRRHGDERFYDLPVERYDSSGLYQRFPRMGIPTYRGLFRDKPHTVPSYYPEGVDPKPKGFHGRRYYEHGQPMKYQARVKDDLYWLEHPPYAPQSNRPLGTGGKYDTMTGINLPPNDGRAACTSYNPTRSGYRRFTISDGHLGDTRKLAASMDPQGTYTTPKQGTLPYIGPTGVLKNRLTQDGVGYL